MSIEISKLRNIAIIAHVDHGKTTMVDKLLQQSGTLDSRAKLQERIMDSNAQESERGITILAKNTSVRWNGYQINILDTPGHADFGGEVERVLSMADSVLLLVDAVEGPMPQTRFVTQKAFAHGLKPIVVINKVDKPGARVNWVIDQVFDLFDNLGASDEQLDFPIVYTIARRGEASLNPDGGFLDLTPLFEKIVEHIPSPSADPAGILQVGVTMIDYDPYIGRLAIGRVHNGSVAAKQEVAVIRKDGAAKKQRLTGVFVFEGLKKTPVEQAQAGDIIVLSGLADINVGETVSDPEQPEPLDFVEIDAPTVQVIFQVNKSPFAGREGEHVTSRKLAERLCRERESDVSLKVEVTDSPDIFLISGRGELHLSILIETMRREGYEFEVSRPKVILQEIDGENCEPVEELMVDVPECFLGFVMERLGARRGEVLSMEHLSDGRVWVKFMVPTRGLFGFRNEFLTGTKGMGIMYHSFNHYAPFKGEISTRASGSLVAFETGETTAYGLENAQERGELFVGVGVPVYRGMVVGENSRAGDLPINVCKKKQLTNFRSSTAETSTRLIPPRQMSLERCLEFLADDELLEITPKSLRIRKKTV
jgi:GTP-binding protein